ncbi:hypothetical protein SSS_06202 [Sarcoptes scabiei]|uniref:Uncharacterized protein n=2 Tax=Sarcoptes scabiei TaxID=52283 RepID=A0A834R4Z8_SARSC|nr:hypothetical protein SSS_06202 [Sarcoptes scabiei]
MKVFSLIFVVMLIIAMASPLLAQHGRGRGYGGGRGGGYGGGRGGYRGGRGGYGGGRGGGYGGRGHRGAYIGCSKGGGICGGNRGTICCDLNFICLDYPGQTGICVPKLDGTPAL